MGAQQYARPISDVFTGNWTTTPLWQDVDEVTPDDVDYIQKPSPIETADTNELMLSSVSDPFVSSEHTVRFRGKKGRTGSGTVDVSLYQGTTLVSTYHLDNFTTVFATYEWTLSAAEADSITDYGNLRVRTVVGAGVSLIGMVSWVELEVPSVSSGPIIDNGGGATSITSGGATLNGDLLSTGASPAYVFQYRGDADGSTNKSQWRYTNYFGARDQGSFSTNVSGLYPNTPYFYRCYATNTSGGSWAPSTACFTTDAAVVQFTVAASAGDETVLNTNLEISISAAGTQDVSVAYQVTGGTADNGVDYVLGSGTATITAGNLATNISLVVSNDLIDEFDESILVTISNPVNATLGGNVTHTYTIGDNDDPPLISFNGAPFSEFENQTNVAVLVSIERPSGKTVTVDYSTVAGTATNGLDYTNTFGMITWTAGDGADATILVSLIDDVLEENDESFYVALSNPINCTISGTGTGMVTIIDDEQGPPRIGNGPGVTRLQDTSATLNGVVISTGGSPAAVWIYWGPTDGETNKSSWYSNEYIGVHGNGSFSNNVTAFTTNTAYFYRCYASNDNLGAWADASTNFLTGPPTIQFTTTESSGSESVTPVTVELNISLPAPYGIDVSVDYDATGGTAQNGPDYDLAAGTATIPAGATFTNISMTISNDLADEFDETVEISLSSPNNALLGANAMFTFTIIDDDENPGVEFLNTPYVVQENGTGIVITVSLSAFSARTASVDYVTMDRMARDGLDYSNRSGTITWLPGESGARTFTVPIIDDILQEGDEEFDIWLSNYSNCIPLGNSTTNVIIIEDDLVAPIVTNTTPADVKWTTAKVGGMVTTGFLNPEVWIYWGMSDGGTDKSGWSNAVYMGTQDGEFSTELAGLVAGTTYRFRCYATNKAGQDWAMVSNFQTMAASSPGNDYYVNDASTTGDLYCTAPGAFGNTGTSPGSPRDSIQDILTDEDLEPGDVIWVDTGEYILSGSLSPEADDVGAAGNYIVVRGTTGEKGTVLDRNNSGSDVVSVNRQGDSYIRFESLKLTGGYNGMNVYGAWNNYCRGVEIVDCETYGNNGFGYGGFYLSYCDDIFVSNSVAYGNGYGGIYMYYCSNVTLTASECYSNLYYGIYGYECRNTEVIRNNCHDQSGMWTYGINIYQGNRAVINSNTCNNNGEYGIYVSAGTATVSGNECASNSTDGINAPVAGADVSGNTIYANGGYGIHTRGTDNARFRHNLVYSNGNYNMYFSDLNTAATIENNTVSGGKGVYVRDPNGTTFRNNIVCASGAGNAAIVTATKPYGPGQFVSDYNNLHASGNANVGNWGGTVCATLGDWQTQAGNDWSSISTNPAFVAPRCAGDFHLQSTVGSYHDGTWQADPSYSAGIDAGNPWAVFTNEPWYNGLTINQGAYGNTPEASLTLYTGAFHAITSSVAPAAAGRIDIWPESTQYPTNREVTVWAVETNAAYHWSYWTGDLSGTNASTDFHVFGDMNFQAVFDLRVWTITASTGPNGTIEPIGEVAVFATSNRAFAMTASNHYHIADVEVDTISIGATSEYTFVNVMTDHTIHVTFEIDRHSLEVFSTYAAPVPSGTNWYSYGSNVACELRGQPVYDGALTQYTCRGWTGTGSVAPGTGTNTTVALTNNSTLTWNWVTNYWLNTADDGNGSVDTADGWKQHRTNFSITAIASNNYHFVSWTGDTNSGSNPLILTMYGPLSVTANFEPDLHTISAGSGPNGSIVPTGDVDVPHGSDTNFVMVPDDHYHVDDVLVDSVSVGAPDNYTFLNVTNDRSISVSFVLDTQCLSIVSTHGSPMPSGTDWYPYGADVDCEVGGSPVAEGVSTQYRCIGWTGTGSVVPGSGTNTTVTLTNNSSLTWQWETNYRLDTAAGPNGGVDKDDTWCSAGTNVSILATPSNGYSFLNWSGDVSSPANPLNLTMDKAYSVTANFAAEVWTISATSSLHGVISPSGSVGVATGNDTNFAITPDPHCYVVDVVVDGSSIGPTNSYTFANVTNDHTIWASFSLDTHGLIVSTPRGSANPSGSNDYDYGSNVDCEIGGSPVAEGTLTQHVCFGWTGTGSVVPGSGTNTTVALTNDSTLTWQWQTEFRLDTTAGPNGSVDKDDAWCVDGTNVSILATPSNGYYFVNWTGDVISPDNPLVVTMDRAYAVTANFDIMLHSITSSAGANGTISPSGAVMVAYGADTNFAIIPDPGYSVLDVVVDGSSVGPTNSYTFANVTNDHTIYASFEPDGPFFTSNMTPFVWLDLYDLTNDYEVEDVSDQDSDGALTWEEYQAGTLPTNGASVFTVVSVQSQNGSNRIEWYATTNSGVHTEFMLYRCTDLIAGDWMVVQSNITRSATGYNVRWDDPGGGQDFFYRPVLPSPIP